MKAVILKSEGLKISMLVCRWHPIFVKPNIIKPVILYEGHQCKKNNNLTLKLVIGILVAFKQCSVDLG